MSKEPTKVRFANEPEKTALYRLDDIIRIVGHSMGDPEDIMTLTIGIRKSDLLRIREFADDTGEELYVMFTTGVAINDNEAAP